DYLTVRPILASKSVEARIPLMVLLRRYFRKAVDLSWAMFALPNDWAARKIDNPPMPSTTTEDLSRSRGAFYWNRICRTARLRPPSPSPTRKRRGLAHRCRFALWRGEPLAQLSLRTRLSTFHSLKNIT